MRNSLFLIIFILFFSACNSNTNSNEINTENWNIFRGNPALTAYTDISLPDNPVLLWTFKSDSYTKSSPVIYNEVVYWSNRRGRIFGVGREGKQVFDYAMETAVDAIPMIYDSVLYIGRIDGKLCAVSLAKQDTLWTFETDGQIVASPNIMTMDEQKPIVIGSYDTYLYLIDKTGKMLNRFESGYYINGAVAQSDNYAVYGGCDGWFRVVDCVLGVQTDSLDLGVYIPASPAVRNNWCYIADHSGNVHEIELDKGKIVSSKKIIEPKNDDHVLVSVPAVSEKMVYIVSDDRHIYAINRKDGTMAWKYLLKGDTGESSPVICNDKLLVCTKNGMVSIHDSETGKLLWEYDTGEQIIASPAVVDGCFYVLAFKGMLFCFGNK